MFNGVLLVAIIATWILKVTSLPKLYFLSFLVIAIRDPIPQRNFSKSVKTNLNMSFQQLYFNLTSVRP